jgi:hypothetical protein
MFKHFLSFLLSRDGMLNDVNRQTQIKKQEDSATSGEVALEK